MSLPKLTLQVHFFCDVNYDPFRFLHENKLIYGFNMNILDDARSFPSLWAETLGFIREHPKLLHPDADLHWLVDEQGEYNNCQFFSNFEIGSLNFFRAEENEKYFDWLDKHGGFFYERFGDAPIHTLSVAMFAPSLLRGSSEISGISMISTGSVHRTAGTDARASPPALTRTSTNWCLSRVRR